jgi:3-phosphoshikimate 1-carboxyvinyltransferase
LGALRSLGVSVDYQDGTVRMDGVGYFGFHEPKGLLDAGNSGSTARMVCGLLAAQPFDTRIDGDASLRRRPMRRIIDPLSRMGAQIQSVRAGEDRLPLLIHGGRSLKGIDYEPPVPSAQVKTAVLLAGLHAEGQTRVRESLATRNHTEIALRRFGVPLRLDGDWAAVHGGTPLEPVSCRVPGDVSSAAFFIAAAAALPGSDLVVQRVGLNPTRTGFLRALESMGARIEIEMSSPAYPGEEFVGSVHVTGSELTGTEIPAETVPTLIDEIPILAVAAALAHGDTVIHGAAELRHKESDRLGAIAGGLESLGVDVETWPDGIRVRGGPPLRNGRLTSHGDHRMAMAWAVASLAADGPCTVTDRDCVAVSYPGFWKDLDRLAS